MVVFHSISFPTAFSLLLSIKMCARFVFLEKQSIKEDFRDLSHSYRNAIQGIKEHQELTLTGDGEGIKKTLNQ